MAYLFDTDAVSEAFRRRPAPDYQAWLRTVPREEQYTSAVVVGELFGGAYRAEDPERHLANIEDHVLPVVTVLPFDIAVARTYGQLRAELERRGRPIPDADLEIASTAVFHGLELVTGNLRHLERVPGLRLCRVFAESRRESR